MALGMQRAEVGQLMGRCEQDWHLESGENGMAIGAAGREQRGRKSKRSLGCVDR